MNGSITKKPQQRLFSLRQLKKSNLPKTSTRPSLFMLYDSR